MGLIGSQDSGLGSVETAAGDTSNGGPTGVDQIIPGTGISVSPGAGVGVVTVTNTGVLSINGLAGADTIASKDDALLVSAAGTTLTLAQQIKADWAIANTRWYAVDGVSGNDSNAGFSDVSNAAAGAVAKKTFAGLSTIFPRVGGGRKAVVAILAGTYTGGLDVFLQGASGYAAGFPITVGTVTNATASSVAFAGDAADRIMAGGVTVPGLNAAGYNPTGAATVSSLPCTLAGGGAPAFPAEPAAPLGWRVRFDSATATAALRNVCAMILGVTTNTLTLPANTTGGGALPAVPAAADVFYVEQAGVNCDSTLLGALGPASPVGSTVGYPTFAGINITSGTSKLSGAGGRWNFCGFNVSLQTSNYDLETPIVGYKDETGTLRNAGSTIRANIIQTQPSVTTVNYLSNNNPIVVAAGTALHQALHLFLCNGSYLGGGVEVFNFRGYLTDNPLTDEPEGMLGGRLVNAQSAVRIVGAIAGQTGTAGLCLLASDLSIGKLDINAGGANPAIRLAGKSSISVTSSLTSTTPSTDVGLDLTAAVDSTIIISNGVPTVTGGAGDIRLAGGQIITWAQVAATGFVDRAGNRFISASVPAVPLAVVGKFSGVIVTSAVGATLTQLGDPGSQPAIVSNSSSLNEYPTSLRLITRLRVCAISGNGSTSYTVTLYKRPSGGAQAATAMQVTVPGGASVGQTFADLAHPILFGDGDTFALQVDSGATAEGNKVVNATLEGPC